MNQTFENLEEGSEEYKKLFLETKEKHPTLDKDTFDSFMKAKKYFSQFKVVENLTGGDVDISKADLKEYTYEENQANVLKAMERLYGDDNTKNEK